MRLKPVALRDSLAGILSTLTAESGGDVAAVADELHSNPVVPLLHRSRRHGLVPKQLCFLTVAQNFPNHIVLAIPSGEESFQWRASWN